MTKRKPRPAYHYGVEVLSSRHGRTVRFYRAERADAARQKALNCADVDAVLRVVELTPEQYNEGLRRFAHTRTSSDNRKGGAA